MNSPLLEVENLQLKINQTQILRNVSFSINPGEIVGLVGESGSGKSLTAATIFGLHPPHSEHQGKILFNGKELLFHSKMPLSPFYGTKLSLILQDPSTALNPLITVGKQLIEGICFHQKLSFQKAWIMGIEWLQKVGISDPKIRMNQYPHELSGGMKQRIVIAMALICEPSLIIADEPTTALDVTLQIQILNLIESLQKENGMSLLLISHDLGVISHICQRVIVMYGGEIIEQGTIAEIFSNPQQTYTQNLLKARQCLGI